MSDKPTLQVVALPSEDLSIEKQEVNLQAVQPSDPRPAALDPFDPANLRLDQAFTETTPVKKLLTTVPVRKPSAQDFVRVRPEPEFRANFPIVEIKDEREEYIVTKDSSPSLPVSS